MPRPRKTTSLPTSRHTLSESARATMLCALGHEDDGQLFSKGFDLVEELLGASRPLVQQQPAVSLYVTEFGRLARQADALSNDLASMNDFFRRAVLHKGAETKELAERLAAFSNIATEIARDAEDLRETKGTRRGKQVLFSQTEILMALFSRHYKGVKEERTGQPFSRQATQDGRQEAFVRAALLDARIIPKTFNVRRLLSDVMKRSTITKKVPLRVP